MSERFRLFHRSTATDAKKIANLQLKTEEYKYILVLIYMQRIMHVRLQKP